MTKVLQNKDKGLGFLRHWKVMTMTLLLLTFSISQMWGASTTYTYTGYTTQIANGWTHNYGDTYVGRKGSNYTPDNGGLPTGNSNIFAAFQVSAKSKIRVVFVWTKTNGDLSDKSVALASLSEETYNKLVTASTGTGNDVKYSISNFSSSQSKAVAINRADANKEITFEFDDAVSAGYYAVYTASSINSSALIKKIIVVPTHTLTWDFDGGSSSATAGEDYTAGGDVAEGATITYPVASTMSKSGSEFNGWSSNATTMPTTNLTITAQWTAASSCAATIPGNITKGTATGGTGTITLTAGGDIVDGDTWYWQDAADGTATDKGSGKTKNVSAAGTYYIRSYNTAGECWSNAKSVEVVAADLLTPITPTLTYGANVIVGNTLSPTLTGNDGSGTVTYALNDVTPAGSLTIVESTGVVTAVTAGGTATVTATIAANGGYAGNTATSGTISAVAAPTHLVENRLNVTSGDWSSNIYTNDPTNITSLTEWQIAAGQDRTAGVTDKQSIKNGRTHGIGTTTTKTDGYYMYLSFTIASGKRLKLSAVNIPVFGIAAGKTTEVEIEDANSTKISVTGAITQDADGNGFGTYDFSGAPYLQGAVTLKMWAYGATSGYRMKSPIYLDGAISEVDVTAPTFVSSVPANSATGVDVSGTIVLTFSEALANVDASKFTLTGATKDAVAIDGTDATKVNIAYSGAANEATVTLTTAAEAVADASGNKSAALSDIAFTTAASGVCVKPEAPEDLGVEVKTNNYAKFIWDNGTAGANGYEIALTSEAGGATGTFDWKNEDDAIYEATGLSPETEYTFKVKYKGTVDDCYSDEVTTTFTTYAACTELVPETSGEKPAVGDEILLQTGSAGGKIIVVGKKDENSFSYSSYGLLFNSGGQDSVCVELNHLLKEGSVIALNIVSNGTSERGLKLQKTGRATVYDAKWTPAVSGEEKLFTYVVTGSDGLKNTNKFWLARNGSVYLKSLTVSNCGVAVYEVTFDMKDYGSQVAKQVLTAGAKVTEPAEPEAAGYIFGGWYKETTLENAWNFSTDVVPSNNMTLYAKWTEDPCTDRQSLSKVVLTSTSAGTTTGYNSNEYAGTAVIGGLSGTATAEVDPSHEGTETGYKLNSGGSAIVFATLKKGTFQEGDKVIVTITKANDAYKVEEVSQPILDIYFGDSKDDATLLKTLNGVTAAGSYTYRLTAADVTAIGDKKGIGVFRPSSGRTQNPHVYSVEITGCREWAITHNVTFNKMGKGADIAPAVVAEGDKVTKPTVVEPEGWALAGWYKEEGLVNEWDFASDVMGTSDITLYAKWESEEGVIKLFSNTGVLNTTNFVSAAKSGDGIEIDEVNYPCLVSFDNNRSSLAGTTKGDVVQYNATTNKAKIKLDLYNNATGTKTAYLWMVEEGATVSGDPIEISIPGKTRVTTSYTSFNSENPRSFYLTSGSKGDIKVLQVKVLDNGTAIPQFGKAGYAVNLNKGRVIAPADGTVPFDGATMHSNEAYTVLNSSNFKPKTYIQFTNAVANTIVRITKASSNAYYVTNDLEHKGDSYTTDKEITLTTTGTWYIGSVNSGSTAAFSAIEFIAPKCEAPAFDALDNSDICEGDPYVALDGTGSVTDGGSITYKWYAQGGTDVLGTNATYTPAADGNYYVVALHHVDGFTDNEATSDVVTVTTYAAAAITTAPEDKRLDVGQEATLTVVATGKAPLTYQWYTCDDAEGTNPVIIDGAESDSYAVTVTAGMNQYYKVVVGSGCGSASATAKVEEWVELPQLIVSSTTVWDWQYAGENMTLSGSTTPKNNEECLMANIKVGNKQPTNDETFNSQALLFYGEHVRKVESSRAFATIGHIKFTVTRPGKVTVEWSDNGTNNRRLKINDAIDESSTSKTDVRTFSAIVTPGEVTLEGVNSDGTGNNKYLRISKITYDITDVVGADYTRDVTEGRYGTICLPKEGVMVGASIFELAYYSAGENKIFMDQVVSGEMVAGRPYVFLPYEGADKLGVFYTDDEAVAAGNYRGLYGYFDGTDNSMQLEPGDGHYILHNNLFREVTDSYVWIDQNRAYFKIGVEGGIPTNAVAPLPGRRRMSIGAAAPQAPTGLENDELINGENGVQKVLINGELFILRGEKMYDATGRLVK